MRPRWRRWRSSGSAARRCWSATWRAPDPAPIVSASPDGWDGAGDVEDELERSLRDTHADTGGGEREPVPLRPDSTRASSELRAGRVHYAARNAFDGSLARAWAEAAEGPGRGEWIEARFSSPRTVRRVRLTTGYEKHGRAGDLFVLNAHLRRLRVRFDDGTERVADVGPTQREVTLEGFAAKTRSVRVTAEDVYDGERWQDLTISEIWIEGEP